MLLHIKQTYLRMDPMYKTFFRVIVLSNLVFLVHHFDKSCYEYAVLFHKLLSNHSIRSTHSNLLDIKCNQQ